MASSFRMAHEIPSLPSGKVGRVSVTRQEVLRDQCDTRFSFWNRANLLCLFYHVGHDSQHPPTAIEDRGSRIEDRGSKTAESLSRAAPMMSQDSSAVPLEPRASSLEPRASSLEPRAS